MDSKLPYVRDAKFEFQDHRRIVPGIDTDSFEDTNDGRGAPLVSAMIIAATAFTFGLMIGLAIGRI